MDTKKYKDLNNSRKDFAGKQESLGKKKKNYFTARFRSKIAKAIFSYYLAIITFRYSRKIFFSSRYDFSAN